MLFRMKHSFLKQTKLGEAHQAEGQRLEEQLIIGKYLLCKQEKNLLWQSVANFLCMR
jgi:hypothetical protein